VIANIVYDIKVTVILPLYNQVC